MQYGPALAAVTEQLQSDRQVEFCYVHDQRQWHRQAAAACPGFADAPAGYPGKRDHVQRRPQPRDEGKQRQRQPCGKGEQWQSALELLEEMH